ncbi:hypothetical protein F183_A08130 [Bryobacterales bacterium F-183]|nr:hypothetical protein F183_A08130 [Bryobacterales bacterium F-183]
MAAAAAETPIVFVHGNGDDATKWLPVIWMFESNGYPADRLHAIRFTDPSARREDSKAEEFRSSTTDQASELSAFVTRVLLQTKSSKVILVGSSRGGLTIRNYVKNAGGAAVVSHAILCGTPNHGVFAMDAGLDGEFNGKGHFVKQLNEGSEVVDGVRFLTIRSDKNDKYAQRNVGYDGPELKGAENVVLPDLDHREVAFHPLAFAEMYRFITGAKPKVMTPAAEASPAVSGLITSYAGMAATNRPMAGVRFRVYALQQDSADRDGAPLLDIVTTATGAWGPLTVDPRRNYEFVLEKDGRTVTYFKSGLLRTTSILNFRFATPTPGEKGNLIIHRPQGYLSKGRDALTIDGAAVEALLPGVPTRDAVGVTVTKGVTVKLRDEVIRARPAASPNELNIVELLWD